MTRFCRVQWLWWVVASVVLLMECSGQTYATLPQSAAEHPGFFKRTLQSIRENRNISAFLRKACDEGELAENVHRLARVEHASNPRPSRFAIPRLWTRATRPRKCSSILASWMKNKAELARKLLLNFILRSCFYDIEPHKVVSPTAIQNGIDSCDRNLIEQDRKGELSTPFEKGLKFAVSWFRVNAKRSAEFLKKPHGHPLTPEEQDISNQMRLFQEPTKQPLSDPRNAEAFFSRACEDDYVATLVDKIAFEEHKANVKDSSSGIVKFWKRAAHAVSSRVVPSKCSSTLAWWKKEKPVFAHGALFRFILIQCRNMSSTLSNVVNEELFALSSEQLSSVKDVTPEITNEMHRCHKAFGNLDPQQKIDDPFVLLLKGGVRWILSVQDLIDATKRASLGSVNPSSEQSILDEMTTADQELILHQMKIVKDAKEDLAESENKDT